MRILDKPEVHLVAGTEINREGIEHFLLQNDLEWPTPTVGVSSAAQLTELAGRQCYMSFGNKAGSKTNQDYLNNLLGRNSDGSFRKGPAHGCYDIETEVLTGEGWKKWPDVKTTDFLATRTYCGELEFCLPKRLIRYEHSGRMYRVDSKGVDLLVTPDHKMLACKTTTKAGRKRRDDQYHLTSAEDLGSSSHAYVKSALWFKYDDPSFHDSLPELLGFAIGDGSMSHDSRRLRFHLRRSRKIGYLRALVQDLEWDSSENAEQDDYIVSIPDEHIELFRGMYTEKREKTIPTPVWAKFGRSQMERLQLGLRNSDGSTDAGGHEVYDTTSRDLADDVQRLCLHIGLSANLGKEQRRDSSFGDKRVYRLHIIRRNLKPEVNKFEGCVGKTSWVEDWSGEVFCAEVPNNTLYVRRNGKPVWSGNSVLEHASWSFIVTGAGRGFSHEQVRHRVGVAYSQLSTRYCDFERAEEAGTWDPGFCIPPLGQLSPAARGIYEETFYDSVERYKDLVEVIMEDLAAHPDFQDKLKAMPERDRARAIRKAARGAARDILPIGTEAIMTMTFNARAIWNMAYLRASEHAEGVIRDVFVQIVQLMEDEFPELFNNIVYRKVWDGSMAVELPRDKL